MDNEKLIASQDSEGIIKFIDDFPSQVEEAWNNVSNLVLPSYYIKIKNVIICGMGGSGLGAEILKSFHNRLQKPVTVIHDYEISNYADNDTLVILNSFSGDTEETVSCYNMAIKKNARILVIATGGAIIDLAKKDGQPYLQYSYNSPPRYGVGYSYSVILAILNKLSVIDISPNQVKEAILLLQAWSKKLQLGMPQSKNSAKQLAQKMFDKVPIIVGSLELTGVSRVWKEQLNESAKTAAYTEDLPDVNHYSVTGTKFPKRISDKLFVIVLQTKYSAPRLKIQENLFLQALDKSGVPYDSVFMHPTNDSFAETYLHILFAEYVIYYLAILNRVNPAPTPLQDNIKEILMTKE